jgi:hypothetical protein
VLIFVAITVLGFSAVGLHKFPHRGIMPPPPPPPPRRPTDDRIPFVLHNPEEPTDRTPTIPDLTPDDARPIAAPSTPEHARVLRHLATAPEGTASTAAATALTGLPGEDLIPLLADQTHARLVERDAVADLWRVTAHGLGHTGPGSPT